MGAEEQWNSSKEDYVIIVIDKDIELWGRKGERLIKPTY